ncbi:hypothetical protein GQ600_21455 [Phytophthora cactorum]|nr:hypothetical protein GQ600_21442 [Phytophthora cactorum]KAF1792753.1 hypothetical protein GQ600_21455 [Phytophthora cactorum]
MNNATASPLNPTDELLRDLSTGNVVVDTFVCLIVSLLLQQLITYLQGSGDSLLGRLYGLVFGKKEPEGVYRIIGITQRFSSEGHKIWDYEQKNHLLQKAISLYLADVLDLTNKDAKYDLLHRPQKKTKTLTDSDDGDTSVPSSYDSESDDEDDYCGAVDGLCWEALPQENEWIEVEEGVQFKHETVEPEDKEEQKTKSLTETNVNFKFFSTLPDGSERIDTLIQRAFKQYQAMERKRQKKAVEEEDPEDGVVGLMGPMLKPKDRLDVIVSERKSQFTPAEVEEFCAEFDDIDSILGRLEQAHQA